MSIPHPTTSFRMPVAVKDALSLMCKRRGYGHPGTWLARLAEEQLVCELGMELMERVGFWPAYQAIECSNVDGHEAAVNGSPDVIQLYPNVKAYYTESEVIAFQARLKGLLRAVGFVEVGRRIRHGFVQAARRHDEISRADNVGFCKQTDHGGSYGQL